MACQKHAIIKNNNQKKNPFLTSHPNIIYTKFGDN